MLHSSRLRVCMVCGFRPTPAGGGTEKHVCELAQGLLARGVDVEIICEARSFLADPRNPLADYIVGIDPASLVEEGWVQRYREKSRRFAALLDSRRHDVIHCHSHYGYHTALALASLAFRPALVTTFHLTPLGSLQRLQDLGLPEPEGAPIDRAVAIMEETAAHLSDRCIAVSNGVAREIVDLYDVAPERVETIYNWYDPHVFFPRPKEQARLLLGLERDRKYVLYIGHFNNERGERMAQTMRLLPDEVTLLAVNDEEDPAIAAEMRERVRFVGHQLPEFLALYYAAADLQCFPPVYGAFGLVLVEGMACGCPPVVFDYPAMNEIVTPTSGYLVGEPSPEAYAEAIVRALADGDRKRLAAIQRARHFDRDNQIDRVMNLYYQLAGRRIAISAS